MGDRVDELTGNVKAGFGKLSGNERLETEGEAGSGTARAKRKTKGALREAGGTVKQGIGKLTRDEATQAEGTAGKLRGKAEKAG
jgi:uncharacterized protein YjbJ (UPF0337 family)